MKNDPGPKIAVTFTVSLATLQVDKSTRRRLCGRRRRWCAGRCHRQSIGLGIAEYEAKRYAGRVKKGGILISVHCDDANWTKKAKAILVETGAEDVSSTGEARADFAKTDRPRPRPQMGKGRVPDVES